MKLLYVNPQSYSNLSKYDEGVLSELTGWDCHYACSVLLDQDPPEQISVHKVFKYNALPSSIRRSASYIVSLGRVFRITWRVRADIVHIQWVKIPIVDFVFLYLLRRLADTKIVLTAHNVVPHDQGDKAHFWLGRIYALVDCIVVHEPGSAREIENRFKIDGAKIQMIRHGLIPLNDHGRHKIGSQIRSFFEQAELKFLFFGRGNRYKGIDILASAWIQMPAVDRSRARLVIVGKLDPTVRGEVLKRLGDQESCLVIDEFVSEADLFEAVHSADAIVFPYRQISQSGALLSTLDTRTPVIVSDCNGLNEPLSVGDIGWSYDGSESELARLLSGLINDQGLVHEKAQDFDAWQKVIDYYSWATIGRDIRAAYEQVASN